MSIAVGEDAETAIAIAAFERAPVSEGAGSAAQRFVRRDGGGVPAHTGPGILRIRFRFPMDGRVTPDAARILNRAVRPLLHALRGLTPLSHYFGRDTVSVKMGGTRHDVAALGFAHDGEADQGIFEAFLGVRRDARRDLVCLRDLLGEDRLDSVAGRIVAAFEREGAVRTPLVPLPVAPPEPPWDAVTETPFARVGAARFPLAVGGDFFASSDWMRHLTSSLADLPLSPTDDQVRALFGDVPPPGRVLLGVETPIVLATTVLRALRGEPRAHGGT